MSNLRLIGAALGLCAIAASPAACIDHPLKPVEYDSEGVGSGNLPLALNRDVDILFVIDNSGSMAEEQATLARNFEQFIAVLERENVAANYRIAITTTDNSHVSFCTGTGAESGHFQLQSCLDRASEFIYGNDEHFDEACESVCELPGLETSPTPTFEDPESRARPWIERTGTRTNLPAAVTPAEAFACFGPQGIAGCGFESTLESMRRAFVRANVEDERSFGFVRPSALLAVVIVTDEEDCSARNDPEFAEVWDPEGNKVFWSEPNRLEPGPTSEVCWFAGVECTGGPGAYDECHPVNRGIDGEPTDEDHSVLYSVQRYIDFLQGMEDEKREIDSDAEVLVAVIGGVPSGYDRGEAEIVYRDGVGDDADYQLQVGIGPGCKSAGGLAVPPVRLRAFAEAFQLGTRPEDRNLYSVCEDDYAPALDEIAELIGRQLRPACMTSCVADTDPTTPAFDASCTLEEHYEDGDGSGHDLQLPRCEGTGSAPVFPAGAEVCWRILTDTDPMDDADPTDDMHEQCIAEGWNLQFEVLRTAAGERAGASSVTADCVVSPTPSVDCPELG
ncbi:MAG: VWA domain-containing protein [Deltaproteobacteria bacterium]|nr:VWA domain-containing protein [Nannocystaceae bacterium]